MINLQKNLQSHVVTLSEEIGERNFVFYNALQKSAEYITETFNTFGFSSEIQHYYIDNKIYKNIIAVKKGDKKPQELIVIGAHYDSVVGSPGANDNGSGVSSLLELARLFFSIQTERTIKFIALVNEEPPFFLSGNMGSRIYAKDAKKRREDIKAMISLETMGYFSDEPHSQHYPLFYSLFYPHTANFIAVVGNFSSRKLVKNIKKSFKKNSSFNIETAVMPEAIPGVSFSDHDSFWRYGYKACMVTDTAFYRYPHYHTREDTPDKINFHYLAEVVQGVYYALLDLTKARGPATESSAGRQTSN